MLILGLEKQILRIVMLIAATVTLIVTPYTVTDPINLPKMVLLVTLAGGIAGLLIFNLKRLVTPSRKVIFSISTLVIVNFLIVLVIHRKFESEVFYGTSGRNTGVLTYLALVFLMLGCVVISSEIVVYRVLRVLLIVGFILLVYGSIQFFGFEPFPFISPYESKVIGTFGNPNFQSAFLGILGAALTPMLFIKSRGAFRLILSVGFLALCTASILQTNSIQGLFSITFGLGFALLIYLISYRRKRMARLVWLLLASGITLVALSFLNIGPLADIVYKGSMAARVFYWKIALKIIADNPVIGIGFDQYGDWLRRYRNLSEVRTNLTADSAHSIYLDVGVGGGIPLLILFLLIVILGVSSVVRVVRRSNQVSAEYIALVGGWVAFQAQSLISINQIGIAIWGWIFTGLIIGYEINTRTMDGKEVDSQNKTHHKNKKTIEVHPRFLLVSVIGLVVGLALALPPFVSAQNYYDSFKTGKISEIKEAVYKKPYHRKNFLQASDIFKQNIYTAHSLEVAQVGVEHFPNSFWLWSRIAELSPKESTIHSEAVNKLHLLDPNNPAFAQP